MVKRNDVWIVFKQIWYIPFIWSLAWFSYWIGYSFLVHNLPLIQIDSLYYYGVTISIAFLIIEGYISKKSKNKTVVEKNKALPNTERRFVFRKIHDEEKGQKQSSDEKFVHKTEPEKPVKSKPPIEQQSSIEKSQFQELYELHQESIHTSKASSTLSKQVNQTNQTLKTQETPSDCLVCPNLLDCPQRQKRIINPETPCPFAKERNR